MFKIYGDGFLLFTCETLAEAVECWGQTRGLYKYRRDFVFRGECYISPLSEEEVSNIMFSDDVPTEETIAYYRAQLGQTF